MTKSTEHAAQPTASDETRGLTLHEERLVTSGDMEVREIGQVRLRKRIVVEELTITVPVRREVVDVVRVEADGTETVVDAAPTTYEPRFEDRTGAAAETQKPGAAGARADADAVLCYEERPVVTTELFAVERVSLGLTKQTHTEAQTFEVRREEAQLIDETKPQR